MEIKILVDYNKKEDLQNFIKVCEQHGFNVTREGGGNLPNWSGWYAELKGERWQKETEQQSNCNLPDVSSLLIAWEQFKKANWWESDAIDVEKVLIERFVAIYNC